MWPAIKQFFFCVAQYDVWSLISLSILVIGSVAGYFRFFAPRKSIRNFLVKFHYERAEGWNFPLRMGITFTNHTGQNVHITSASFKCKDLRPAPNATVDTQTRKMPIKFPKPVQDQETGIKYEVLEEFEFYIKVDQVVGSYAPLDPSHTDQEIVNAFKRGRVGTFDCYVTLLSRKDKPTIYRLKLEPKDSSPAKAIIGKTPVPKKKQPEREAGLHEGDSSETAIVEDDD